MLELSTVAGRYRVSRVLYTRGVTSTYLASDVRAGDREVVLEVAPVGDLSADREAFLQSLSELTSQLSNLEHANLAPVQELLLDGPYFGFVKAHEPGALLKDWLSVLDGPVPMDRRISLCRDILEGLAALHGVGILHRNLRPRNVWLVLPDSPGGRPVAQLDSFHRSVQLGDGDYVDPELRIFSERVAPEVGSSATYSTRSDVFAAGLLLLEILNPTPSGGAVCLELDDLPTEEEIRRRVPGPYAEVVVRATRESRLERFQDGLDLLAAFDAIDLRRRLAAVEV